MSNQPEQTQPIPEEPYKQPPAGYFPPPVPPYQAPVPPDPYASANAQFQQPAPPYGQQPAQPYGQPPAQPYGQEQYAPPSPYGQQRQQFQGQQPQYPAPTYYQGGTGYPAYSSGPRGLSLASMIVGLASLVVGFGFLMVPQIVGVILGHLGMSRESPQGRGFAITGLITNYLALLIYGGLYAFVIFSLVAFSGDSYSGY